jgi:hypothetical protein
MRINVSQETQDCIPCKLVSGFGLIGIGLYVVHQAKNLKPSPGKKIIYFIAFGKKHTYSIQEFEIF